MITFEQTLIFNSELEKKMGQIRKVTLISAEDEPAKWNVSSGNHINAKISLEQLMDDNIPQEQMYLVPCYRVCKQPIRWRGYGPANDRQPTCVLDSKRKCNSGNYFIMKDPLVDLDLFERGPRGS